MLGMPRPIRVSIKPFTKLASLTPQSLNTWAEMLPRAEALCEVARINAASEVCAITVGTVTLALVEIQNLRRSIVTTWKTTRNNVRESNLEASLVAVFSQVRAEIRREDRIQKDCSQHFETRSRRSMRTDKPSSPDSSKCWLAKRWTGRIG